MSQVKEKYVLREGVGQHTMHKGPGNMEIVKPGEVVELTENQAHIFRDKFKSYAEVVAESEVARRTVELQKAAKKQVTTEKEEDQERLRAEAEATLAAQYAEVTEGAEQDDDSEDDTEEAKSTSTKQISSSAKNADLKAQGKNKK